MYQGKEYSREKIAQRAYELYAQRGRDHGRDVGLIRAEAELSGKPIGQQIYESRPT